MQGFTLGAGLASLAFWGFIAAVVVAGIWSDIRKKEGQQETIRRLFESGQPIDNQMLDKLLTTKDDKSTDRLDRMFKLTGLILFSAAVGLATLGMVLGISFPDSKLPILGAAGLVLCIGLGFLVAAKMARGWYEADSKSDYDRI